MSTVVWLGADTVTYPSGGGHLWEYLHWALGLRAAGCEVVWLEAVDPEPGAGAAVTGLKSKLDRYGLGGSLALCSRTGGRLPAHLEHLSIDLDSAGEADLLLNLAYDSCQGILHRFRRKALVDIDPGLTQVWAAQGMQALPRHDVYFSVGENLERLPDLSVEWRYTPRPVALDWWPLTPPPEDAPFTTVTHWDDWREWFTAGGESFANDKRSGFLPFLDLPSRTSQQLELALCLEADGDLRLAPWEDAERRRLVKRGWRVVHAHAVASTPWDYQAYVGRSRGEFSCAKPSCIHLGNAWIGQRTLCYLAAGRPAVVQHTGPSDVLPDREGLFRFKDLDEAATCLEAVAEDYDRQAANAHALVEERFDASRVVPKLLEHAFAARVPTAAPA